MISAVKVETTSPQFVRATAQRLAAARGRRPRSLLAWRSGGRLSRHDLNRAEHGELPLDFATVTALAAAYGVSVADLMPSSRTRLSVQPTGRVAAGGVTVTFNRGDGDELVAAVIRVLCALRPPRRGEPLRLRECDARQVAEVLDSEALPPLDRDTVATLAAQHAPHCAVASEWCSTADLDRAVQSIQLHRAISRS